MNQYDKLKIWLGVKLESLRKKVIKLLPVFWLQLVGSFLLVVFYALLVYSKRHENPNILATITWACVGIPAGIIELLLIWAYGTTITKYVRSLASKRTDTVVMLALIGATWWLAGPFAAGFFFCGFLDNHFGERQE